MTDRLAGCPAHQLMPANMAGRMHTPTLPMRPCAHTPMRLQIPANILLVKNCTVHGLYW